MFHGEKHSLLSHFNHDFQILPYLKIRKTVRRG